MDRAVAWLPEFIRVSHLKEQPAACSFSAATVLTFRLLQSKALSSRNPGALSTSKDKLGFQSAASSLSFSLEKYNADV